MKDFFSSKADLSSLPLHNLLDSDEYIAVVDDSPEIVVLLSHYLKKRGFKVLTASNAADLFSLLDREKIALTLLDIGLPDKNGNEIIQDLTRSHPDLSIIMVTGTISLKIALDCLRQGVDDYLTKPVNINLFHHTVQSTLLKRRLAIDNRLYQEQLKAAHSRMLFLHHLNLKMNSAYLNAVELNPILQAILVGITSGEGLKFNRAFMALYNEAGTHLEGKLAIGPASREHAGEVWEAIRENELQLDDILSAIQDRKITADREVNQIVQTLRIPALKQGHILIYSSEHKKTIQVIDGKTDWVSVPQDLIDTLGGSSFVVVPLYSPARSLGVIIADNFVTRTPISPSEIADLEIFAAQASLAIEHSHLYQTMGSKISELESVTEELEKNKNLLVHAERSATHGKMAGRLVHEIRNPLTSIGVTSRLLARKTTDAYTIKFLDIISKETEKIEATLKDLLIVAKEKLTFEVSTLFPLIRQSVMSFYQTMKEKDIEYILDLEGDGPKLLLDEKSIRQTFIHLMRNRIEAMDNGGCLKIAAEDLSGKILISIVDSGPLTSATVSDQAKNQFVTGKKYESTIGLSMVGRALRDHGGSFTQTTANGATLALILLPVLTDDSA